MKLSELQTGQNAIIKSIGDLGGLKDRLMELGVLCGEPVQTVRVAPLGDPIEIRIGNEQLALRKEDAQKIEVEMISRTKYPERKGLS
ncbi:FeoA family protein [Sulfurovum sp.]|uniref:FeoA family protein n=1 Tax=Sulfurovum sp. TaxID=1969726 RepID=UPI0025D6DE77|nr:FeoA family protein [Sulfurovum sp.]